MNSTLPDSLPVALKEWSVVCRATESGRQIILLRKGGIYESAGEFQIEHRQFPLFPTFVHQNLKMLKPSEQAGFQSASSEPTEVKLSTVGQITDIIALQNREQMDNLDDQHIWSAALVDMRFTYRAENPLYLLLTRAWKLPEPVIVPNTPAYAGCKSWVPLERAISTAGATPALDDEEFQRRRQIILERLK